MTWPLIPLQFLVKIDSESDKSWQVYSVCRCHVSTPRSCKRLAMLPVEHVENVYTLGLRGGPFDIGGV